MTISDLRINGTSLTAVALLEDATGALAVGPLRGENLVIPGLAGAVHLPKVRGAYVFTLGLALVEDSAGGFQAALDRLAALVDSSTSPLTVTRVRPLGAGSVTESCQCDYLAGLEPVMLDLKVGRVALDLLNLSGGWS